MMNRMGYSHLRKRLDRETPYLLVLCMEYLNQHLEKEPPIPTSSIGVKLCSRAMPIPCLLFADDCLLYCKANRNSYNRLKKFCNGFEQLVNHHKSILTFSQNALICRNKLSQVFLTSLSEHL